MMANKVLNLDFLKNPILPPIIYGRVGDNGLQTVTVNLTRGDEAVNLTGGLLTFEGEPAGGKVKVFDSDNISSTAEGLKRGTFDYTFPSKAFSVEGTYERAYFSFQKGEKRDTTNGFKIIVQGTADIDAEEAETIITEYNRLVEKLNKAYQDALKKINVDYESVVSKIEEITTEIAQIKAQITETINNAEKRIDKIAKDTENSITTIGRTVTEAMDQALEELRSADFYTQAEADSRFINKTTSEKGLLVFKNTEIKTQDWNTITTSGVYTVYEATGENRPEGSSVYGRLLVYADNATLTQQYIASGKMFLRTRQGSPAEWTNWQEIALKEDRFIYKKSGLNEVETAYKTAFGEETNILLIREGDKVDAYLRVNVADVTKLKTAMVPIFVIPEGFKIDQSLRGDFWNVALTTVQYTFPQGNYGALYEMNAKGIRFGSDRKGNHYVHGSWRTADPFPKSGSLGTGTVTTFEQNKEYAINLL
ncbi:BppU family phage baseplate upper protein [Soonwooa sp.]|uniref:BppU family phage baseplate upper protein n=1 Tax=Soonwooa sp. TaxID=1938592 RepID=UPI00289BD506|nr:BppU family phage baseplate upper protein [Soonwooa sp.]